MPEHKSYVWNFQIQSRDKEVWRVQFKSPKQFPGKPASRNSNSRNPSTVPVANSNLSTKDTLGILKIEQVCRVRRKLDQVRDPQS